MGGSIGGVPSYVGNVTGVPPNLLSLLRASSVAAQKVTTSVITAPLPPWFWDHLAGKELLFFVVTLHHHPALRVVVRGAMPPPPTTSSAPGKKPRSLTAPPVFARILPKDVGGHVDDGETVYKRLKGWTETPRPPSSDTDESDTCKPASASVTLEDGHGSTTYGFPTRVFGPEAPQDELYAEVAAPLVAQFAHRQGGWHLSYFFDDTPQYGPRNRPRNQADTPRE
jgi:hypothetical protein